MTQPSMAGERYREAVFREAALAAFCNAESLSDDVRLLYEHGRFARALSLSIIGAEELGKAILYTIAALDRMPGLPEVLQTREGGPLKDHAFKQFSAEIASISHSMIEDGVLASNGDWTPANDVAWLDMTLSSCADWLKMTQIVKGSSARRAFLEEEKRRREALRLDFESMFPIADMTLDGQKWLGFYVDLSDGSVTSPESISEGDALSKKTSLEIDLDVLWRLKEALSTDEFWEALERGSIDSDESI